MSLVDTHCHIHMADYQLDPEVVLASARQNGVDRLICVGTDVAESERAVTFAADRPGVWASVGLHPHDAQLGAGPLEQIGQLAGRPKVVAIGECGLDYYYNHSPKSAQQTAFRAQLEIATTHNLPLIFHVRDAFADFWPILDDFPNVRGVIHSFTATTRELDAALARNLYIGLNGIMTFTKDQNQLSAARAAPLEKLLLETDAPFLTPKPHRGTINEPKYIGLVSRFLAELRQEDVSIIEAATTKNAIDLFGLD